MAVDLVEKRIAAGRCHRSYALDSELASSLLLGRVDCLLSCCIESPYRKLAPRQRTSFVAIHGCKPPSHVGKNSRKFRWPLRLCHQVLEQRP
jgi:hypothetical protein